MELNNYQKAALETAVYPDKWKIYYPAFGLNGEAGEVADKVKKIIRDNGGFENLTSEQLEQKRHNIMLELGDVLWYVAVCASDLGLSLEDVAKANINKLQSRKRRGKIGGSGDER